MLISEKVPPTLEEAKKIIHSKNFNEILNKMVLFDGWIKEDANKTCEMYKNYIFLKKKYFHIKTIVPSEDIDEFWHYHILSTQDYQLFSDMIFGKENFLHHYPYFGIDGVTNLKDLGQAFDATQELYFKEFGSYIVPTRSKFPKLIYSLLKKVS